MNLISFFLIYYFYVAITVFVIGTVRVLIRWTASQKGKNGTFLGFPYLFTFPGQNSRLSALKNILSRVLTFSSMHRDRKDRAISLAFHWSLWIIILAHADIVLMPFFLTLGVKESTMETIGGTLGTALAIVMIIAGVLLIIRRVSNRYIRRISNPGDYFSILLIVAIGLSGLIMRFTLSPFFAYTSVSPFFIALFSGSPLAPPPVAIFYIHFALTSTLFLYFPLGKFMHPYSFFVNPTLHTISHEGGNK